MTATDDPFVHLHVHTEHSMLDGATQVPDLVKVAAADGAPGVAMTDHGVLHGAVELHDAAKKAGITPIIGLEGYQAAGSMTEQTKTPWGDRYYHLTLLAASNAGWTNLSRLSTRSFLDEGAFWHKARFDLDALADHADGLIALSGCLGGQLCQHLLHDDYDGAKAVAGQMAEVFGRDRYLIEVMNHDLPEDHKVNPQLFRIADELGLRVVATNDSHYTHRDDYQAHDALLCIGTGAQMSDPDRFKFHNDQFYVKSAAEMRRLWSDHPEACDNTLWVAEQVDVTIDMGLDLLPAFPCPDGKTEAEHLAAEVWAGARKFYGDTLTDEVRDRVEYELRVIDEMGFNAYFLIVQDLVRYAREVGIRVGPGRGSAGGSVVAYCTGITRIDPIKHGLIFERFLNPARRSMPDIDMDFDDARRAEMIEYSRRTYGEERVAQVLTFGTIKAKSAIKDAGRVLGKEFQVGDRLTKAFPPPKHGQEATLEEAKSHSDFVDEVAALGADATETLEVAAGLEGLKRQPGVHAAAVLIGGRPLVEDVPLMKNKDGLVLTQWEMNTCEARGLLKMDFLGLRNLGVMMNAERHIKANRGDDIDVDDPLFLGDMDDPLVYAMLSRGETLGVFQLDSSGMQELVRRLKPTCFEDISALLALYRPGPMGADMHHTFADRKNGREDVAYAHPDLEPILGDTYGVLVYQESVMRIATDIAGFTMSEADGLRKAVGKKKADLMASMRQQFVDGSVTKGYDKSLGVELWDLIEAFAAYGFNKAHTVGYGVIAYQTAWLKAHYPVEYLAALLTSVSGNKDVKPIYLAEAARMGISVLPPDVNESLGDFAPVGDTIRFGLEAIKGIGEGLVESIVAAREDGEGPFTSIDDFCLRVATVDGGTLNKAAVTALAKAGAFASLGYPRKGLSMAVEQAVDAACSDAKKAAAGQDSLFGAFDDDTSVSGMATDVPDLEYDRRDLLALEREYLGLYVSDHPLRGLERVVADHRDGTVAELPTRGDGTRVTVCGVVTALERKTSRKGDTYAVGTLEDESGSVEFVAWPRTYAVAGDALQVDKVVAFVGKAEVRDEAAKVVVDVVRVPDTSTGDGRPLLLTVGHRTVTEAWTKRLRTALERFPGETPVHLRLRDDTKPDEHRRFLLGGKSGALKVDTSGSDIWGLLKTLVDDVGWPQVQEFGEVREDRPRRGQS